MSTLTDMTDLCRDIKSMIKCRLRTLGEWLIVYTKYYNSAGKIMLGMDPVRHNDILKKLEKMSDGEKELTLFLAMVIPTDNTRLNTINNIFVLLEQIDKLEDSLHVMVDYNTQSDFNYEQIIIQQVSMHRLHDNWVIYDYTSLLNVICKVSNPQDIVMWINSKPVITKFTIGVIQMNISEITTGKSVLLDVIDKLRDDTLHIDGIPARFKVPHVSVQGILYQKLIPACKSLQLDDLMAVLHMPGISKLPVAPSIEVWERFSRNIGNVIVLNCTSDSPIEFNLTGLLTPSGPLNTNTGLNKKYIEKYNTAVRLYGENYSEPAEIKIYEFNRAEKVNTAIGYNNLFTNQPRGLHQEYKKNASKLQPDERWKSYDTTLWYVFQTLDGYNWRPLTNTRAQSAKYHHPQLRTGDPIRPHMVEGLQLSLSQIALTYSEVKFLVEGSSMRAQNYNYLLSHDTLLHAAYDPMVKLIHAKYINEVQSSTETIRSRLHDAMMEEFRHKKVVSIKTLQLYLIPNNLIEILTSILPIPDRSYINTLEYIVSRTMKISKLEREFSNALLRAFTEVNTKEANLIRAYKETTDPEKLSDELYAQVVFLAAMIVEKKELWQMEGATLKEVFMENRIL